MARCHSSSSVVECLYPVPHPSRDPPEGTHKRVYFQDIKRYKEDQKERSYTLLAELQAEAQAFNMGY